MLYRPYEVFRGLYVLGFYMLRHSHMEFFGLMRSRLFDLRWFFEPSRFEPVEELSGF
jgi:hypothetical protein